MSCAPTCMAIRISHSNMAHILICTSCAWINCNISLVAWNFYLSTVEAKMIFYCKYSSKGVYKVNPLNPHWPEKWPCLFIAQVANFQISDRTTNYQMSKNGPYPSKHVHLCEMFHKENYLSLKKVIPMDKFANHYIIVF